MALNEVPRLHFFNRLARPEPAVEDAGPGSRLLLFRGSDDPGHYVSSPFVTKVEFRLRLGGVGYSLDAGAPWLGPKGKIPYLHVQQELESSGSAPIKLGDSTLIIKHLVEDGSLSDLNSSLPPSEKARDLALRSLLEDKLYFYHMRECWVDNYYLQRDQALWSVPLPIRVFVGRSVYGKVTRTLYGQGCGRLTSAEVDGFRREIWTSFDDLLQSVRETSAPADTATPFWALGGQDPTEADITLFSFIASIHSAPSCPDSQALLRSLPALMDYAGRIHEKYFSEYAKWKTVD